MLVPHVWKHAICSWFNYRENYEANILDIFFHSYHSSFRLSNSNRWTAFFIFQCPFSHANVPPKYKQLKKFNTAFYVWTLICAIVLIYWLASISGVLCQRNVICYNIVNFQLFGCFLFHWCSLAFVIPPSYFHSLWPWYLSVVKPLPIRKLHFFNLCSVLLNSALKSSTSKRAWAHGKYLLSIC